MKLPELLGIDLPIIQAPMAGVQGSALAVAVSNAGGLGSLPCAMLGLDAKSSDMTKGRLEAFTDGVIAVIITIMVLELKVPHDADPKALVPLIPVFLSYVLSFVFVGIYWNNHHHMFHAVHHVNGATLWANLHLLFWLSLVPFVTGWMNENHFAAFQVAAYGLVLLGAACAYTILTRALLATHAKDSPLANALGKDFKGKISVAIYVAAIPLAFVHPWIACGLYVLVAAIWLFPDRRFEKLFKGEMT